MIKASFRPPKLTTKKVWAGLYGGHYDQIIFFKSKPVQAKEKHRFIEGKWYDCFENKDLIIGDMSLGEFREYFPDADLTPYTEEGRPKAIDIPEVFALKLKAIWDKKGRLLSIGLASQDW
jgi:hypothetical protein